MTGLSSGRTEWRRAGLPLATGGVSRVGTARALSPAHDAIPSRMLRWAGGFRGRRLLGGAVGAVLVMAFLAAEPISAQLAGLAVPWWSYPTSGVAALLVGMVIGSFAQPARGAEPTVCEVGPLLIGVGAAYLGSVPRAGGTQAAVFLDSLGAVAAAQPALAGVAVLLLAGAVADRAKRERYGEADTADGEACVSCAPLFPPSR